MTDDNTSAAAVNQGLKDLMQKLESTLVPAIEEHVGSEEFSAKKDGLDFLDVKNSLLLSYLIETVQHFSSQSTTETKDDDEATSNLERLTEMKIALEKIRPLEKKMRYQLDKLLSTNDSSKFATSNSAGVADPLSFRPNPQALKVEDSNKGLSSDSGSDDDDESDDDNNDDIDDDLAAARATLKLAGDNTQKDDVYRAPRLAATPYPASTDSNDDEKRKRFAKKLRATELAKTLRDQYGDAPEQEDIHGGGDYGRQKEASRKLNEMEREKTKFEEDNMIRLTTSKKQKQEKKKLMREESSNLSAISDLGNLTRSVSAAFDERPARGGRQENESESGKKKKRGGAIQARNSLQKALYGGSSGGDGGDAKKKQKNRR